MLISILLELPYKGSVLRCSTICAVSSVEDACGLVHLSDVSSLACVPAGGGVYPHARARDREAVPDARGGRVQHLRPRHRGHWQNRARCVQCPLWWRPPPVTSLLPSLLTGKIKTGEDLEVVGLVPTQKTICTGEAPCCCAMSVLHCLCCPVPPCVET
jgi:hypothetical protein